MVSIGAAATGAATGTTDSSAGVESAASADGGGVAGLSCRGLQATPAPTRASMQSDRTRGPGARREELTGRSTVCFITFISFGPDSMVVQLGRVGLAEAICRALDR